jgi:hypothetical protein
MAGIRHRFGVFGQAATLMSIAKIELVSQAVAVPTFRNYRQ